LKIKLAVSDERYEQIKNILQERGIAVCDSADLILYEANRFPEKLTVKRQEDSSRHVIPVSEIVVIESFGHTVEVHTQGGTYQAQERLYQLSGVLDPDRFLRISNSVIIAKDKVKRITPALSMKFSRTMSNGRIVDVTRSYYYIFKEAFGI